MNKKMIALLGILLIASCFVFAIALEPGVTVSADSVTSATLKIKLEPNVATSQYVWVGFTKDNTSFDNAKANAFGSEEELSLAMSETDNTAYSPEESLYLAANFNSNISAEVILSGTVLTGTGDDGEETLGYTITNETSTSKVYLTVNENDQNAVTGTESVITHTYDGVDNNERIKFTAVPLRITTTSLDGKSAESFTASITATVESV